MKKLQKHTENVAKMQKEISDLKKDNAERMREQTERTDKYSSAMNRLLKVASSTDSYNPEHHNDTRLEKILEIIKPIETRRDNLKKMYDEKRMELERAHILTEKELTEKFAEKDKQLNMEKETLEVKKQWELLQDQRNMLTAMSNLVFKNQTMPNALPQQKES